MLRSVALPDPRRRGLVVWREFDTDTALREFVAEHAADILQIRISGTTQTPLPSIYNALGLMLVSFRDAARRTLASGVRGHLAFICWGTDIDVVLNVRDQLL
jgi:hypothetical protein